MLSSRKLPRACPSPHYHQTNGNSIPFTIAPFLSSSVSSNYTHTPPIQTLSIRSRDSISSHKISNFMWFQWATSLSLFTFMHWRRKWQCACLENPRDGGAWWAAVYGVTQSRTRLKRLSSRSSHVRKCWMDFTGGPVAKTPGSQCRGSSLIPGWGTRSHMSLHAVTKDPACHK